ncbi:unnamed protein product [Amoebophrya sp. A120]|nr:unnamed protein product [Amoebophrya sp. A120]|eukprot:GSA120T00013826001.1
MTTITTKSCKDRTNMLRPTARKTTGLAAPLLTLVFSSSGPGGQGSTSNYVQQVAGHALLAIPISRNYWYQHQDNDMPADIAVGSLAASANGYPTSAENPHNYCPNCMVSCGPDGTEGYPTTQKNFGICGDPRQNADECAIKKADGTGTWDYTATKRQTHYFEMTAPHFAQVAGSNMGPNRFVQGLHYEFAVAYGTWHDGHFEFRLCDKSIDANDSEMGHPDNAWRCLHQGWNPLERVDPKVRPTCYKEGQWTDAAALDADCQPLVVGHEHRWYLPPQEPGQYKYKNDWDASLAAHQSQSFFHFMWYKIPMDFTCEQCTLVWHWWTANTCTPNGLPENPRSANQNPTYAEYFASDEFTEYNQARGDKGVLGTANEWRSQRDDCDANTKPEEFANCADVKIVENNGEVPTHEGLTSPLPVPSPVVSSPDYEDYGDGATSTGDQATSPAGTPAGGGTSTTESPGGSGVSTTPAPTPGNAGPTTKGPTGFPPNLEAQLGENGLFQDWPTAWHSGQKHVKDYIPAEYYQSAASSFIEKTADDHGTTGRDKDEQDHGTTTSIATTSLDASEVEQQTAVV